MFVMLSHENWWKDRVAMNATLLNALVALVPVCVLLSGSTILFLKARNVSSLLQLLGAGCLIVVVFCHISEGFHLFPQMDWGLEQSIGHYIDLWSAALGLTLFPVGYLFHALSRQHA
jgi:hypothetical protein